MPTILQAFLSEYQTEVSGKMCHCMNPAKGWVLSDVGNHYRLWACGSPYENMDYRIRKDAPWGAVLALMDTARLRDFHIPGYGNQPQWDLYALVEPPEDALPYEEAEKWLWKPTPRPKLRHKGRGLAYAHKEF